jgi:Protein of unknown function (DUF1302)
MHRLCPYLGAIDLCYSPNRGSRHGKKLGMAYSSPRLALLCALGLLSVFGRPAGAAEIYAADGLEIRLDNTVRYSAALRPNSPGSEPLSYINGDDGDRNFAPGLVSNRFDLLSELDIAIRDFGVHASAAAWYDTVYQTHTDNTSSATNNAAASARQFAPALRSLQGQHAELLDAFAYGNFTLAQMPVSVRAGRQTLLGGESRFFDANSIAAAMAPTDYLKTMTDQNGYSGNMFLPVTQVSLTLQPLSWLSLSFYDQFEWRASRQPGDGSYLSYLDYVGAGATRLFLTPDQYLVRNSDPGPASGQYGFTLRGSVADVDLGLYAFRFRAKDPIAALAPDPALAGQTGAVGYYRLAYPSGINLYGASFSTEFGGNILAGEFSARQNMPLVGYDSRMPQLAAPTRMPYYAKGNTLHTQISIVTELAETFLWDKANATAEIATDNILSLTSTTSGTPPFSGVELKARARIEPTYFQALPNLDITGVAELGFNLAGHSFNYYAQNNGSGDFRLGVSGTYLSAWKAGITYVGFLGAPSRQPLADRDFVMLNLERTF